jgi:hypothetical protein
MATKFVTIMLHDCARNLQGERRELSVNQTHFGLGSRVEPRYTGSFVEPPFFPLNLQLTSLQGSFGIMIFIASRLLQMSLCGFDIQSCMLIQEAGDPQSH